MGAASLDDDDDDDDKKNPKSVLYTESTDFELPQKLQISKSDGRFLLFRYPEGLPRAAAVKN